VRLMMDLALNGADSPVQLGEIARRQGISGNYLGQIVMSLKHGSLIRGQSGKNGGHSLSRPSENITFTDIVEASIGPVNVVECVMNPDACGRVSDCEIRRVYSLVNSRVLETLGGVTLADLVSGSRGPSGGDQDTASCAGCSGRDLCNSSF